MATDLSEVALQFLALLTTKQSSPSKHKSPHERLDSLRKLVLLESIPSAPHEAALIRPMVWKVLLRLHVIPSSSSSSDTTTGGVDIHPLLSSSTYYSLTNREPSIMFSKIRNDTFRTLATDKDFREKVGEERLVRCLEAFVWRQLDGVEERERDGRSDEKPVIDPATPYVQGMNVLAAPFLSVLPTQLEAFACFSTFIETQAPRYVRPTLDGVHAGLHLVDRCLAFLDPPLFAHLTACNLSAELYAFPSLLTFSASTPPLSEVLELWDFLLSWGCGLNVLCVVAQLWVIREDLLKSTSPMKLLRIFPPLKTKDLIPLTVNFVSEIPKELYDAVVRHPWDDTLHLT